MKRLICILLLVATLLSVFTVTAFAEGDDNVTGGDGDTADALAGYGWYNTFQFMWKVSLYIGKSDQATTNGNLTNDYYQIGEYVYVKRSWTIPSGTQFGTGTKVSQYSSGSMGSATSVKVVVDGDCPAVPVACEGDIPTVKAYFGSTGTMSTILNALAEEGNTTKYGLVSEKNFTIGGVTKSGWPESYLLPSSSMTNRVPWVIIYEPVVLANMKDRVTKLAFTATEFAIAQKNGWYNFRGDYYGENAQKISKLTHQHLPTSVQLEESWYGYPVYNVTNDGQYWTDDNIIRGGGWGMRYLPVSIMEPVAPKKDFSVSFGLVTVPSANGYGSVNISFKNNKSFICSDVFCELYRGTTLVWSGYKNFLASQTLSQIVSVYYSGSATQTLTAKINYEDRNSESNPHNNVVTHSVTPTTAHVPLETTSKDFGVYFGTVDTPDANSYGSIEVNWKNYKATAYSNIYCELWLDSSLVYSGYKSFAGNQLITQTYSVYYAGSSTRTLVAKINYVNKDSESDPNDNLRSTTVTPTAEAIVPNKSDYGCFFGSTETPESNSYGSVIVNWRNYQNTSGTVLCELYLDSSLVWSGYKSFYPSQLYTETFSVYYSGSSTRTLTARINYAQRYSETDPNDNLRSTTVTPTIPIDSTYDFSVSGLSVTPNPIYQGDYATVSFRSDNWNRDLAYSNIPIEVLVNGNVAVSTMTNFVAYGTNNHTYTVYIGSYGTQNVTARINWANRYNENDPENNNASTSITSKKKYEFSVSDISVTPSSVLENNTVNVSFRTDNWDLYNGYSNIPVEAVYNGSVIATQYVSYSAYGGSNHSFTVNVGSRIGISSITARVNWYDRANEKNPNNNSTAAVSINVMKSIDLSISPISPNSGYRAGTEVITSYYVYNSSRYNIIPTDGNTVSFEAYYMNGATKVTITNASKSQVVIPANGSNLVYFKWTIPQSAAGKTIYCVATVNSESTIQETNESNNKGTLTRYVSSVTDSQTPDTNYEDKKPSGWSPSSIPASSIGSLTWSEWIYSGGSFVRKTYGVALTGAVMITPDSNSPSAEKVSGVWNMKSGYGFAVSYLPTRSGVSDVSFPGSEAYTAVQRAYSQFPEFNFSNAFGKYRTLKLVSGSFAFTTNSVANGARLHYSPVWFPNGVQNYQVSVYAYDFWTPAGMLSTRVSSNKVSIIGSAYDDWFIGK